MGERTFLDTAGFVKLSPANLPILFHECLESACFKIDVGADENHFFLVFFAQSLQVFKLLNAKIAPGLPIMDDDDLAFLAFDIETATI